MCAFSFNNGNRVAPSGCLRIPESATHLERTTMPGWLCKGMMALRGKQKIPMDIVWSSKMWMYVIGGGLQSHFLLTMALLFIVFLLSKIAATEAHALQLCTSFCYGTHRTNPCLEWVCCHPACSTKYMRHRRVANHNKTLLCALP